MNSILQTTLQHRKIFYSILKHTPKELLLKIPNGFRNNIYWNIGHILVTQQLLIYQGSKMEMVIPDRLIARFRKGTVPNGELIEEERDELSAYLFTAVEATIADWQQGAFKNYEPFTTATKTHIKDIEDAMVFNLFHEGLHLGVIMSLQKANLKN